MNRLPLILALALPCAASADDFTFQRDKQIHFAGSVLMGAAAMAVTDSPVKAFAGCSAVGGVIELLPKVTGHGVASVQDFAYDMAGCALGAFVGHKVKGLLIAPSRGGVRISYSIALR